MTAAPFVIVLMKIMGILIFLTVLISVTNPGKHIQAP